MSNAPHSDEASPLLRSDSRCSHSTLSDHSEYGSNPTLGEGTPLSMRQIIVLCYARMVEPIAFFSIFPFVNKMIFDTGVAEEDVGFYSGLIESVFSVVQVVFMIPWGLAADRYGRRPVLLISLFGLSVSSILFGLSTSVVEMIVLRSLAGMFGGSLVTVRTMLTENSNQSSQARTFSYFALAGNMGMGLGPFISGALADPIRQYPNLFGEVGVFKRYPYILATIGTGIIGFSAFIASYLVVRETLCTVNSQSDIYPPKTQKPSKWQLLRSKDILITLLIHAHIIVIAHGYMMVTPLFWFTDVSLGGLGLLPLQMSFLLAIMAAVQALWTLFAFPPLQKRIGTGGVIRICTAWWPLILSIPSMLSVFRRLETAEGQAAFGVLLFVNILSASAMNMVFAAIQLAINNVSPGPEAFATLNAISLTNMSAIRTVLPAASASIYAIGVGKQILGGQLAWILLIAVAISCAVLTWTKLPRKVDDA